MKVAPLIAVALILCIAFPCQIQAKKKPKPKFCVGKDGNQYAVGEGYDDNDGKACVHYKCVKKKKKFVMKRGKCVEDGEWSSWSSWSACSSTCGSATKTRKRTCSSPAPSNGGNPCSGPEEQIEECSNPSCGPDMNVKVDSLELNVQSLNDSVQTLQTTMLSVLELMTTMQAASNKQGTCMSDLSSSDCPDSAPGKVGVVDGITTNVVGISNNTAGVTSNKAGISTIKAGVTSAKADIKTNKAGISVNMAGVTSAKADIYTNKAGINTNKASINTNKAGMNTNKADINTNKAGINTNKAGINTNKAGINTNKGGINTNKAGINTNKADINTNKAGINNNKGGINNNKVNINTNKAGINTNKADINTNKEDINNNKAGINTNKADINTNKEDINNNKAGMNNNEAGINTNKAGIMENKASIAAHHDWTIIQRRGQFGNAEDYFYKDFKDYEDGFGSVDDELWIGLKKLAALTKDGEWELQVDLTDWDNKKYHAKYGTFSVGPAPTYTLHVGGFKVGESTLGDSMDHHDGQAFSARDKDQDAYGGSCAVDNQGGWWYKYCQHANLNGLNFAQQKDDHKGIRWYYGKDRGYGNKSWRASVMKIKPVKV